MQVLRRGSRGDDVEKWQNFLRGQGFDEVEADGIYGGISEAATKTFQQRYGLSPDGVVGNRTYGKAMELGFDVIEDLTEDETGPNWPPRPASLQPLVSNEERAQVFGRFQFVPAPRAGNPEAIKITDGWERQNIVKVEIPQLIGVSDAPHDGIVYFHAKVREQVTALFKAWEDAGLLPLVLTWGGSYVPRFVRGSRSTLSNHAFGSAFDINVEWNPRGVRPMLKGRKGSVRELAPLANEHGFYWGGHYRNRPDGMHFEMAKRL
jgi:hypothetical protein